MATYGLVMVSLSMLRFFEGIALLDLSVSNLRTRIEMRRLHDKWANGEISVGKDCASLHNPSI